MPAKILKGIADLPQLDKSKSSLMLKLLRNKDLNQLTWNMETYYSMSQQPSIDKKKTTKS